VGERDKAKLTVDSELLTDANNQQHTTNNHQQSTVNFSFRHTKDIIKAIEAGSFPNQVMITVHPQRWNDAILPWAKELVLQKVLKRGGVRMRKGEGEREKVRF
jgi:hypothetical protein